MILYRTSKNLHKLVTRCSFSSSTKDRKVASKIEQDACFFFRGEKQGNLWPYLYGAPEHENDKVDGGRLYQEVLKKAPEYYLFDSEAQLFQSHSRHVAEIIGGGATVIELTGKQRVRCSQNRASLAVLTSLEWLHWDRYLSRIRGEGLGYDSIRLAPYFCTGLPARLYSTFSSAAARWPH